jgi:hypothetical protein
MTAGYLRRFTAGGKVRVDHLTAGLEDEGPAGVGYAVNVWPERVAAEVESLFGSVESDALGALRRLPGRWPLDVDSRAAIAQFIAIHMVRMPAFMASIRQLGEEATREIVNKESPRGRLDAQGLALIEGRLRSEDTHMNSLLRQVPRIASMLSSMRWSLVRFEDAALATCDQPVVLLPPAEVAYITPASSIPDYGAMNSMEVRFPLDPNLLLLLTWHEDADDTGCLSGTFAQACSVNAAVRAQRLEEIYFQPGTHPPFRSPPLLEERIFPISMELLPQYTPSAAIGSRRRRAAEQLLLKMVDDQAPADEMRWVRVRAA